MSPWARIIRVQSKNTSQGDIRFGGVTMSTKTGKTAAVSEVVWWLSDKIHKRRSKKRTAHGTDAIDNIERLYRLKKRGAISEEDFQELKEKLKKEI